MFNSGATAALLKDAFPEEVGIIVSQDAVRSKEASEVMDGLSDVSLVELEPDVGGDIALVPERIFTVSEKDEEQEKIGNMLAGIISFGFEPQAVVSSGTSKEEAQETFQASHSGHDH